MAVQVTFELKARVGYNRSRYPWSVWTNGKVWLLERGKDYTVSDESMRAAAYSYAYAHGLRVRTSMDPRGVIVQFVPPQPQKAVRMLRRKRPTRSKK